MVEEAYEFQQHIEISVNISEGHLDDVLDFIHGPIDVDEESDEPENPNPLQPSSDLPPVDFSQDELMLLPGLLDRPHVITTTDSIIVFFLSSPGRGYALQVKFKFN